MPDQDRPFQSLAARLAGEPIDNTLREGVPSWLITPLRNWLSAVTANKYGDPDWVIEAVLRLRWDIGPWSSYTERLVQARSDELLDAIDAVLQLHPGWSLAGAAQEIASGRGKSFVLETARLVKVLDAAGSAYTVSPRDRRLVRRVDRTVQKAVDKATSTAPPVAADHLQQAWIETYGLNPDPDKAYAEAVKAVEALAVPLLTPNDGKGTLGKAITALRDQREKWESVIGDPSGQPANLDRWIGTLELLWKGQARHAGGYNSRRHNQEEAEAAVHLAATLVQWLATNALRKRP